MKRIVWTVIVITLALVLAYLSRFWVFDLWERAGLLGITELRPQGGLIDRWLRGTFAAPFGVLIWVLGTFGVLTLLQKLFDKLNAGE